MRTFWKAALAALSFTAFIAVTGGAGAQPYDPNYDGAYADPAYGDPYAGGYGDPYAGGYGDPYADPYGDYGYDLPPDGVPYDIASGGYCDAWGCPDDFYDLPVYYGPVYYDGLWFNGPLYWRDWGGRRQYWIHGGWRYDSWRGARPSWYRAGRYGPALGRSFYSSSRFRNSYSYAQRNRGFDNRGGFSNRGSYGRNDNRGFANRGSFNRNDNRSSGNRSYGNRSFAAPQAQATPQVQNRGRSFGGQAFQRSNAGRQAFNGGGSNRGSFQRSQSSRPQQFQRSGGNRGSFQRGGGGGNRERGGGRRH